MSGCPSYAHRAAGVHQARVPHLFGAPRRTTALAGPHRLMPVLVPAVVPLVPSNKANGSSLHGAAFPTESTLRIQAFGVHDRGAITSRTVCWLSPRLLTNQFDLDRSSRYLGARSARLPCAAGSWLTRRGLLDLRLPPLIGSRLAACPPRPPLLASSLWTASPACALPGSL
jgi:hypothetical protein